jgi:hypothetical protein
VRNGDNVSTGATTSARVILNPPGGIVQLDENTDPEFTLIKQGACLLIKFIKGQGLLKNAKCVEAAAGGIEIVLKSLVNLKSTDQETQITVLEGHVDVTSPAGAAVERLQQYSFTPAGGARLMQLTAEQANATAAWAQRYFRPPSVEQKQGLTPAQAITAAAVALGLFELLRHGSSSHSEPSPSRDTTTPVPAAPPPATAPRVNVDPAVK